MNTPADPESRTVRILISSPGDVLDERERARQIIESLRRRYARRFALKHVLWEDLPLQPDMSFQQGIDLVLSRDGGVDIGVFILWSRLGSPLGPDIRKRDGSPYLSGTEREFDILMQARAQSRATTGGDSGGENVVTLRPHVLVYRRIDEGGFHERLRDLRTAEQNEMLHQKGLLENFFAHEFKDSNTGVNLRAYHSFNRPSAFSQRLRKHLQELLDQMSDRRIAETVWDTSTQGPPFMGLEAFQQRHADVFFGREEEILEARSAFREQARSGCAFLLLCGASGSGKSSLARAGILPAIVENEIDEQVTAWRSVIVTPFELAPDPIAALVSRLASAEVLPELLGDTAAADFVEVLRRNPEDACRLQLPAAFTRAAHRGSGPIRLLVVVDQLEELFTSAAISARDRSAFLAVLETMARSGSIWVLATVRSDFYAQMQKEPALVRMKAGAGQLDILPPGADALRRIVEEPARSAGLHFQRREDGQDLADLILRDAAEHPELLPLVEDLLRELYERRKDDELTFEAYEQLGNSVEGALALRAEKVFTSVPLEAQASLGDVLEDLVTLGDSGADDESTGGPEPAGVEHIVRRRAELSVFPENTPARRLVDAFVAQRLFTTGKHPETGVASITVAHESLLRIWPRAVAWARNNRDFLSTRAHVARRLEEGSPLLEGDPLLGAARDHLARNPAGFPEELRAFIASSVRAVEDTRRRAEQARLRRRRQVYIGVGAAIFAVLAAIFVPVIYFSVKGARDARAAQLVSEAERNLSQKDYARGEIAAAAALRFRDTPETRELLVNARSSGVGLLSCSLEEAPHAAFTVFSRDGSVAAAVLEGREAGSVVVSVTSTEDHRELWRARLPPGANAPDSMALSEPRGNGSRDLAMAWPYVVSPTLTTFHVGVWTLEAGKPADVFRELLGDEGGAGPHTKRIPAVAFHPSQPWIATCSEDKKLSLWDYSREHPVEIWDQERTHDTAVHGIAFNRDGRWLASCGGDYAIKIWETEKMVENYPAAGHKKVHAIEPLRVMEGHTDSVFAVAFSPDDQLLASGGYDRIIRIWNLASKDAENPPLTVGTLSGHEGTILALTFTEDNKLLVSGAKDETVRLWDVSEGRLLSTISPGTGAISSLAMLEFGRDLHAGGRNGWSVWSVRGRSMASRFWNGGATVAAIAFDPVGKFLAAAGNDGKVRLWDRAQTFRTPEVLDTPLPVSEEHDSINGIAFSADGRWLAAAGEAGVIHVWDRANGWTKVTPADSASLRHDGAIWGLCFDPKGRWLASSNTDKNLRIRRWKLTDWSLLDQSEELKNQVYSLACDPAGLRLISGDSVAKVSVRETEHLVQISETTNVESGELNVWSVAVAQSPLAILSGNSDGRVYRWVPPDIAWTGASAETKVRTSDEDARVNPTINSISFSRKRGWVVAAGDGPSVEIYDSDLRRIRGLRGHSGTVWFVSFDPEGTNLAYGGTDRILRVFNLDEMDAVLKTQTPEQIYRDSRQETGLSVEDGQIKPGRSRL